MELCKPPQDQLQKMPRILPQFNGQLTGKPKYLMLNPPNSKDEYISDGNDDLESNKPFKRPLTKQPQVKTLPGHHFLPHKDRKQTILKQDEMIDYDKPQNLKTIPLLSPVEQDIMERRFNAMATHGIGLVVTKNGIEIRAADYHPTGHHLCFFQSLFQRKKVLLMRDSWESMIPLIIVNMIAKQRLLLH